VGERVAGGAGTRTGVVRWSRARRTAIVALDGALAVGTGAVVGTGTSGASVRAAATGAVWSATRAPLPSGPDAPGAAPNVRLVDESCSSAVTCAAVGVYEDVTGQQRGLLETLAGGSWTATEPALPLNGAQDSPSYFDSVSCPRDGWCKAGGVYEDVSRGTDVVIDTLSGGHWMAEQAPLPADAATGSAADSFLKSIDCTGVDSCTAVGSYKQASGGTAGFIDTLAGSAHWSSQTAPQPAGAAGKEDVHLNAVSCPAVGACAASGSYTNASGNDQALLLEEGAGGWVAQDAPLPTGAAPGDGEMSQSFDVSCDGGVCQAVGLYVDRTGTQRGLLDRYAGGDWSATEAPVPANGGATPGHSASLNAVSCTFDGCVAVGAYEDVSTGQRALIDTVSKSGSITATEGPQPADRAAMSNASLAAVSCLSVAYCTAVGSYQNATRAGTSVALTDMASGGAWSSEAVPVPRVAAAGSRPPSTLETVSCAARGACAAAGDFQGRRAQVGLLLGYTPPAGYWANGADGGVFAFGRARFYGAGGGGPLNQAVVGMAATPDGGGYWEVARDGGVFSFGDARFHGSAGGIHLSAPVVGIAATPSGNGYWLAAADGGVFTFGDAQYFGSPHSLPHPITGIAATPDGHGYWLVAADGGIFRYGDAGFYGSPSGSHINAPIIGVAATPTGDGYWVVAADGGVFGYGDARYHGSANGRTLANAVVGLLPTLDGNGYGLVSVDGGVFSYGDATYLGSPAASGASSAPTVGGVAS
jgi:hypothetical protein